jgi:hydrogenase maturation protease
VTGKILVFGIGNPGRGDDGLGPALIQELERQLLPGIDLDADYQLSVEDSLTVSEHEVVVFVDADVLGPEPCSLRRIGPAVGELGFSTHGVEPGGVLALAQQIFGHEVEAYLLGIRGYELELSDQLTAKARGNLRRALELLLPLLLGEGSFAKAATPFQR